MTDAWGSLPDLIRRTEELDEDATGLSEDVVTMVGDTEESVRVCGEVRTAIQRLMDLLQDASGGGE